MKLIFSQPKWLASSIILVVTTLVIGGCTPANQPPVISSFTANEERVAPAGSCQVECTTSDPDEDELSYIWTADGGNISGEASVVIWTAPDAPGAYTITVEVNDGRGSEATAQLAISVVAVNHPPIITNLTADKERVIPSGSCQVECIASDPDGDELSYEWLASGGSVHAEGSIATWTAPVATGTYTIMVRVTADQGGESSSSLDIDVAFNNPPIIENLIVTAEHIYLKEIAKGYKILKSKSCEIECIASDPDGNELLFEWSTDGGNISGEGPMVTWTAPLRGGEVTITVTVSDSRGGVATKSIVFKVETCAPCAF